MWVLECDGDLFGGKKKWLKPGQNYLFGRTKADANLGEQFHTYRISNKSVSRKHLIIAVAPVASGQGSRLYEKSEVTLTDESKFGTHLDGEKLVNRSQSLSSKVHTVKLGSYDQTFRISWQPVVFTFSYTVKEQERHPDILAPLRQKLEPYDIKTILTYSHIDTTHVVASKRNIPKSLQALVNAKYIVKDNFIDAIVGVCTSKGLTDDEATQLPSPLEDDFEANWPNALSFVPDPGKEPVVRPIDCFAPNPDRLNLFEGFTFVFADETQYEQLSPVVMNGGGKAVRYNLKLGETNLKHFVQYVLTVADRSGTKDLAQTDAGRKAIVVRFRGKGSTEQWALDFLQSLDVSLGQRSIEQNEFLDAILNDDAQALRRPLEERDAESYQRSKTGNAPTQTIDDDSATGQQKGSTVGEEQREETNVADNTASVPSQRAETKEPSTRGRFRRPITESRFKGRDDFDPSQLPKASKKRVEEEEDQADEGEQVQSRPLEMEADSQSLFIPESQPSGSNKKRALSEHDEDEDTFETLLPAATAMKRRRLEDKAAGIATPIPEKSDEESPQVIKKAAPKKKKERDIRAEARLHAEELDKEWSRRDPESKDDDAPNNHAHDEDISQLRDLAIVEDMPVHPRDRSIQGEGTTIENTTNPRWDDRWNGLKNFKQFRRQGDQSEPAANRGRRVLVRLEEVKRKDYGIGENYWLEPSSSNKRDKRHKQGRNETQSQTQTQTRTRQTHDGRADVSDEDEEILPEEVAGQPREGPVADALAAQAQAKTSAKRKSTAPAARAPPIKRTRQTRAATQNKDDESSDEDALKFRLKKRRG